MVETVDRKPVLGHAKKERVVLFGTDQRITSGPAAKRPHSKAGYMTAPERFADSQIPLAPRAPSIHDPQRSSVVAASAPRIEEERANISHRVWVNLARSETWEVLLHGTWLMPTQARPVHKGNGRKQKFSERTVLSLRNNAR